MMLNAAHLYKVIVVLRGGQRVGQLVQKAFEQRDNRVWVVPIVVTHVNVQNTTVELSPQGSHHLLLSDFTVYALVVYMQLDQTRAHLNHHWHVL